MSSEEQIQAERSHILKDLVLEMGGLAHEHMNTEELDHVLDNMLTKASPSNPSVNMQRWVHTHRNNSTFKIYQILGAHVARISSLIPDCFGKFHDATAAECRICMDRVMCSAKTRSLKNSDSEATGLTQINLAYPLKALTTDVISEVLSHKYGQIAKTLHHGNKVTLVIANNKLRVLTVDAANKVKDKEIIVMGTKGATKAVVAEVEEDEEEVEVEGEELEEDDAEEEGEEEEEDDTEAPAVAVAKVKKAPKPKPVLNKAQTEFQDALNALASVEDKQKYSQKVIKSLGIAHDNNADARVAHMQRVMAIKKHLATATVKKVAAAPVAVAVAKKAVAKK